MIIGLFTEILPGGGVQRAGRHVAAVAAAYGAEHGIPCRFLSLNDPQGLHTVRVGSNEFSVSGYARSKSQFVLAAMRAAGRRPQLLIALHPHLAPVIWLMKQRARKCRSIVFAHGIEVWRPLGWPRGPALRRADLVIGPSADTVQHLISDQRIPIAKTRQLPWGLDPEFETRLRTPTKSARPESLPAGARIILTVGRWDPAERYKGADTLISALPNVLRIVPETALVLVGGGEDRPRLEKLAAETGVAEQTRFLSGLTADDLFACYANCDIFALPSSGEGFGFVFLEAMALSKPVIGGAHGGIPDVVQDGVTGLLVPHGEVGRLTAALLSLLANPERSLHMGASGLARVRATYTFEHFQSRLTQLLTDVLYL
jgi:phosphatidyl-myo-inositol dimannoside synthase